MLNTQLVQILGDAISPTWEVAKWHIFIQTISKLSQFEMGIEDVVMYLPAVISSIHSLLDEETSSQLALHSLLATLHNLRGHRFMPYQDAERVHPCALPPVEDVLYHACMVAFVDDAVQNKFPSKSFNRAYDVLSLLMKAGITYSLYLSWVLESKPDACDGYIASLSNSSILAGTMFSLLSIWSFPFDHPEIYTQNKLLVYTVIMYIVNILVQIVALYEFSAGSKYESRAAEKLVESFFIAGASIRGLNIVGDFIWKKMSVPLKVSSCSEVYDSEQQTQSKTTLTARVLTSSKNQQNIDDYSDEAEGTIMQPVAQTVPYARCEVSSTLRRVGLFALKVGSIAGAAFTLYNMSTTIP